MVIIMGGGVICTMMRPSIWAAVPIGKRNLSKKHVALERNVAIVIGRFLDWARFLIGAGIPIAQTTTITWMIGATATAGKSKVSKRQVAEHALTTTLVGAISNGPPPLTTGHAVGGKNNLIRRHDVMSERFWVAVIIGFLVGTSWTATIVTWALAMKIYKLISAM